MSYAGKKVNSRKIKPIKITHHMHGILAVPQKINPKCCKTLNLINQQGTTPQM
jgi:hypothetical protein